MIDKILDAGGDGCWRWMLELVAWMPEILGCQRYWDARDTRMPKILDAGDAKCWRRWVLEVLSAGRRGAGCCFIIV